MTDTAPCKECGEEIEENVRMCPECDYDAARSAKFWGYVLIFIGSLASLTLIGALIGVPLIIIGLLMRLGAHDATATGVDTGRPWWRKSFLELYRERRRD